MYSENSGASWGIVARNVHPQYYSDYITYDFIWLVINLYATISMYICSNV